MAKSSPSKQFREFTKLTGRLLAVPKDVLQRRIDTYNEQVARNPNKRGPKPKS